MGNVCVYASARHDHTGYSTLLYCIKNALAAMSACSHQQARLCAAAAPVRGHWWFNRQVSLLHLGSASARKVASVLQYQFARPVHCWARALTGRV